MMKSEKTVPNMKTVTLADSWSTSKVRRFKKRKLITGIYLVICCATYLWFAVTAGCTLTHVFLQNIFIKTQRAPFLKPER